MTKHVMFISVPLRGHTNQLIALAEELAFRGYSVSFVIHATAKAWITDPRIQFIPWDLELASKPRKYTTEQDDFWSKVSQEPSRWRSNKLMLERLIAFYPAMYQSLKQILKTYSPDCLVVDRAAISALDLAIQNKLPLIIQTRFLGDLVPPLQNTDANVSSPTRLKFLHKYLSRLISRLERLYVLSNLLKLNQIRELCANQKGLPNPWHNQTMIVGTSFGIERPRPLPPNVHMVGPIFSRTMPPLDDSLREWLESSLDSTAIVYMAFGTLATLSFRQAKVLVEGLAKADIKVLWALPEKQRASIPSLPPSFRVESFVPQRALLAHAKISAFVSHCGMNSINEALYWGKPILALPFFGDQYDNAARLVELGVALRLDKDKLSGAEVCKKINQILHGQPFRNNASQISSVLQQTRGLNEAADIVERVLLQQGARV